MEGEHSQAEYMAAKMTFRTRMQGRAAAIGGTVDGTTSISAAEKSALVKMFAQPDFN